MSIDDPKAEVESEVVVSEEKVAVSEGVGVNHDLAKLRQQKGLSIEEVASTLRISEDYVDALEKRDLQSLPEPAFIRGYLRKYAPLLDCEPDVLIAEFDQAIGQDGKQAPSLKEGRDEPMTLRAHRTPSAAMGLGLLALVLVAGLSYFAWNNRSASDDSVTAPVETSEAEVRREHESLATEIAGAAPQGFEPSVEEMPENHEKIAGQDEPKEEVSENQPEAIAEVVDEEPQQAMASEEEASESQPQAVAEEPQQVMAPEASDGKVPMVVRFKDDCWIEVRDATERVLVSGLRRAGTNLDLNVLPPVSVRLGNAPGIEDIILNNSPVEFDASRRVASLVLEPARS